LIYTKQGKYKKALEELNKTLDIQKKIFGEKHSFVKKTKNNIQYIKKQMIKKNK
jgi:hypothetical protein